MFELSLLALMAVTYIAAVHARAPPTSDRKLAYSIAAGFAVYMVFVVAQLRQLWALP